LIVGLIIGKHYPLERILLSFTGWKSVGNSNWYIFVVLCLYVFTFLAGILFKKKYTLIAIFVAVCGVGYIFVVSLLGKGTYWYDTILCYPAGMMFAVKADKINCILKKSMAGRVLSIVFTLVIFLLCYYSRRNISNPYAKVLIYELTAILFVFVIVALTTVFVVSNKVLSFLGQFVFEIYILQRIPMILLKDKIPGTGLYFVLCFGITLIISVIFRKTEELYAVHKS
jgi:peptidoglycan/LPS O-acetylase OafA/YrhL